MELKLPTLMEANKRNPYTGRFMKGHEPFNKGKKAKDYVAPEKYDNMIAQLHKYRKGRADIGGRNKREVAIVKDGRIVRIVESSVAAAKITGAFDTNIRKVCQKLRHSAAGYNFYYTDDPELLKYNS